MATTQKKTTGGSRAASGRSGTASRSGGSRKKAPAPRPIRREVGAVVCLLLAIFSAFGYFHIQAIFIDFFCGLVKGLIGYGYWLLPPMLLVASGILLFHRGRPVRLRVWCALLTPVLAGGLLHLILAKGPYEWNAALVKTLWTQGEALQSGGVVSGAAALGLSAVFSPIGAGIILVLVALILLMAAFRISPVELVDKLRARTWAEYEEEELPEPRPRERRRKEPEAPAPAAGAQSAAQRRQAPPDRHPGGRGPPGGQEGGAAPGGEEGAVLQPKALRALPRPGAGGGRRGWSPPAEAAEEPEAPDAPAPAAEAPAPEPAPVPPMPEIQREPAVGKVKKEEAAQAAAEGGPGHRPQSGGGPPRRLPVPAGVPAPRGAGGVGQ